MLRIPYRTIGAQNRATDIHPEVPEKGRTRDEVCGGAFGSPLASRCCHARAMDASAERLRGRRESSEDCPPRFAWPCPTDGNRESRVAVRSPQSYRPSGFEP